MEPRTERYEKVYVNVNSDFDSTGYMQPRLIRWKDGRIFKIDEVRDFFPASKLIANLLGDCYTVVIHGSERRLFFEKTGDLFPSRCGRWFIMRPKA